MEFHNFSTVYDFEVTESNADIPTKQPCLGDLGNKGQLPVQEVLRGTSRGKSTFLPQTLAYFRVGGAMVMLWL